MQNFMDYNQEPAKTPVKSRKPEEILQQFGSVEKGMCMRESPMQVKNYPCNPMMQNRMILFDTPYGNRVETRREHFPFEPEKLFSDKQKEQNFQSCSAYDSGSQISKIDKTAVKAIDIEPQRLGIQTAKRDPPRRVRIASSRREQNQPVTCNCKKSRCLKFYCDCFSKGEICGLGCNCLDCHNNEEHSDERINTMKTMIERNPRAFDPKVLKSIEETRHAKGCNCKRSGCQKRYCECYQAGIACTNICKCDNCQNKQGTIHPPRRRRR